MLCGLLCFSLLRQDGPQQVLGSGQAARKLLLTGFFLNFENLFPRSLKITKKIADPRQDQFTVNQCFRLQLIKLNSAS